MLFFVWKGVFVVALFNFMPSGSSYWCWLGVVCYFPLFPFTFKLQLDNICVYLLGNYVPFLASGTLTWFMLIIAVMDCRSRYFVSLLKASLLTIKASLIWNFTCLLAIKYFFITLVLFSCIHHSSTRQTRSRKG